MTELNELINTVKTAAELSKSMGRKKKENIYLEIANYLEKLKKIEKLCLDNTLKGIGLVDSDKLLDIINERR